MLGTLKFNTSKQSARNLIIGVLLAGLIFFLFFWRLGTLVPGMSAAEVAARNSSRSFSAILNDPVNAPHKLVQFVFQYFDQNGAFWMRLPSAVFAVLFLFAFYYILKSWFDSFISFIGTFFLAATPFIIILARSATPDIMLFFPVLIFSFYAFLSRNEHQNNAAWFLFISLLAISLYIPAMAWLVVIGLSVSSKRLVKLSSKVSSSVVVSSLVIFLLLISPLAYAIIQDPAIVKSLLLLPNEWHGVLDYLKSFIWTILAVVWRTSEHIPYIIGRLPLLDLAQVTLALIGIYALMKKAKKVLFLLALFGLATLILAAINKNIVLFAITMPAVAFLVASGLRFLYMKWFSVFPKNPLPRGLAITLMSTLVFFHLFYGVRYALIAWPNTQETKKAYVLK